MKKILVGTDTTASADLAVQDAAELARARGAELLVLYVAPEETLRSVVDPAQGRQPGELPRRTAPSVRGRDDVDANGSGETLRSRSARLPRTRAPTRSWSATAASHGSWWRVRDSVPNLVLRHSPCSVYVVDTRRAQ